MTSKELEIINYLAAISYGLRLKKLNKDFTNCDEFGREPIEFMEANLPIFGKLSNEMHHPFFISIINPIGNNKILAKICPN